MTNKPIDRRSLENYYSVMDFDGKQENGFSSDQNLSVFLVNGV